MWPFAKAASKASFQGYKTVRVRGWKFVIRRLNPMLDFPSDRMPQIFTSFQSRRPAPKEPVQMPEAAAKRVEEDVRAVIAAAVIEPHLVPVGAGDKKGQEDGITVEDIFRDPQTALALYIEVMTHSLNAFGGFKGVFFSIRTRLSLCMSLRKRMAEAPSSSSSPTAATP